MIQDFSLKNNVQLSQIKNNVYRSIETGNWWKLDAFFSNLNLALRGNDSTMINELSKKGTTGCPRSNVLERNWNNSESKHF